MKAVIYSKQIPGTSGIENTTDKFEVFEDEIEAQKRYYIISQLPDTSMAAIATIEQRFQKPHRKEGN